MLLKHTVFVAVVLSFIGEGRSYATPLPPLSVAITGFRVEESSTVSAYVVVADAAGEPVFKLPPAAFAVKDNGSTAHLASVKPVSRKSEPIAVVVVLDTSGSMTGRPLADAKAAATGFVNNLSARDQAAVFGFDVDVRDTGGFTADKTELARRIASLEPRRKNTCLYDATCRAVAAAASLNIERRAVVILTDGHDTASTKLPGDCIAAAREKNVAIYTIGLGPDVDGWVLKRLGHETNGSYSHSPQSENLTSVYFRISRQLDYQYLLTYDASAPAAGEHMVEVTVSVAGLKATATRNYTLPAATKDTMDKRTLRGKIPALALVGIAVSLGLVVTGGLILLARRHRTISVVPRPVTTGGYEWRPDSGAAESAGTGAEKTMEAIIPSSRTQAWAELSVIKTPPHVEFANAIFLTNDETVFGRATGCDVALPGDEGVSRRHFKIIHSGQTAIIEDLDSSNGTSIKARGGESFKKSGRTQVTEGTMIAVGEYYVFEFHGRRGGTRLLSPNG